MQDDDDTIKILQASYKKKLPEKIEKINLELHDLLESKDREKLNSLFKSIHMLSGSAGSHGYPEVSNAARDLEAYLKEIIDKNMPISLEQEEKMKIMLRKIQEIVEKLEKLDE